MIRVTRKNGDFLVVNADLIKTVEETPDTILTLRDGEKILVRESADEVIARVVGYQRQVHWTDDATR